MKSMQPQFVHTSIVFNERVHFVGVMDVAVVENEDASRTWVGISKGDLHAALESQPKV